MAEHSLLDELDEAAVAAGDDCYCGRSPDVCEDAGGCPASREIARLRVGLSQVLALCRDTDGNYLPGEAQVPVGEFLAAITAALLGESDGA